MGEVRAPLERDGKRTSGVVPVLPEFLSELVLVLVLGEVLLRKLALLLDKLLGLLRIGIVQPVVRVGDGDFVAGLGGLEVLDRV